MDIFDTQTTHPSRSFQADHLIFFTKIRPLLPRSQHQKVNSESMHSYLLGYNTIWGGNYEDNLENEGEEKLVCQELPKNTIHLV